VAVLDRYIGELQGLHNKTAVDSLTNPAEKTSYGLGVAVGRLEGLRLAEELLTKVLSESEVDGRESGRSRNKA
jgi:hypothetical protein